MTRRSFLSDMLKAGVACTFLPGAGRIWKPTYAPTSRNAMMGFLRPSETLNLNVTHLSPFWFEPPWWQDYLSEDYKAYLSAALRSARTGS